MIDELHVSNIALIRDADLVPSSGLTVLTGETGAGKTALLSALKLILGERADSSTVREGESAAMVEARLFAGPDDGDGFCVQRRLSADGRSRVKIDGSIASVRELAGRVAPLVDLCGQHEHQRLLDPTSHVSMVDAWAGEPELAAHERYQACFKASRAAAKELKRLEDASRAQGSRVEEARFALARIDEIDPKPGEFEHLEDVLPRSEHAEELVRAVSEAHEELAAEGGALDAINEAVSALTSMARVDRKLGELADELSSAVISLQDCASELRRYRDGIEFDPAELARMQDRHRELKGLLRTWGPTMDDVFSRRKEAAELIGLVDNSSETLTAAREALAAAERDLFAAAKALKRARNEAAPQFCREVAAQMARLEMGSAELVWEARDLPRGEWTPLGPSSYELLYRSGAGLTPRPLRRIASGGELSRVMLACKVVLGNADHVDTLVFDEVDAGVGGSTARSLGTVIADLAKTHQVIVVTHLAQVAVAADKHYVVSKTPGDVPETHLIEVTGENRVNEIARMLSGDLTEASLAHARQMLDGI